jgi:hypothetical protein
MLKDSPTKSLLYISTFLVFTPIALFTSLFALFSLTPSSKSSDQKVLSAQTNMPTNMQPNVQIYASLPKSLPTLSSNLETEDARPEILREYLSYYNSPLVPYSTFLVKTADKYNLDFRLLVAIAQQESNLCKKIPANSYNCWGWGIHSQGTLRFNSYEQAISEVARGLKKNYIEKGFVSVDEIMDKWVPHSPERSWAKGVSSFMTDME